jgi:hypothetical protein
VGGVKRGYKLQCVESQGRAGVGGLKQEGLIHGLLLTSIQYCTPSLITHKAHTVPVLYTVLYIQYNQIIIFVKNLNGFAILKY